MNSRTKSRLFTALGVITIVIGSIWIGQGTGLLQGSAMTGQSLWLVIGVVVAAAGVVLLWLAARAGRDPNGPSGQH